MQGASGPSAEVPTARAPRAPRSVLRLSCARRTAAGFSARVHIAAQHGEHATITKRAPAGRGRRHGGAITSTRKRTRRSGHARSAVVHRRLRASAIQHRVVPVVVLVMLGSRAFAAPHRGHPDAADTCPGDHAVAGARRRGGRAADHDSHRARVRTACRRRTRCARRRSPASVVDRWSSTAPTATAWQQVLERLGVDPPAGRRRSSARPRFDGEIIMRSLRELRRDARVVECEGEDVRVAAAAAEMKDPRSGSSSASCCRRRRRRRE